VERAGHATPINAITFGTEKTFFATIGDDGIIMIWNLLTYQLSMRMYGPNCAGKCAFLYGKTLITGWSDGWIRAYDCISGHMSWNIVNAHQGNVNTIFVSKNVRCAFHSLFI
jgi:hypothetical protein